MKCNYINYWIGTVSAYSKSPRGSKTVLLKSSIHSSKRLAFFCLLELHDFLADVLTLESAFSDKENVLTHLKLFFNHYTNNYHKEIGSI